ncbi:hypothetical protein IU433_14220 [Nocardia puris]|uniref:hypothetical protein n=1 Tax=Nocardia puris TaxID=208602 RepID=UPI0018956126|nr:hypothetical protein [Nocardia puris]MBF6460193.1 hypothetical protein [Nocardia puris]
MDDTAPYTDTVSLYVAGGGIFCTMRPTDGAHAMWELEDGVVRIMALHDQTTVQPAHIGRPRDQYWSPGTIAWGLGDQPDTDAVRPILPAYTDLWDEIDRAVREIRQDGRYPSAGAARYLPAGQRPRLRGVRP